MAGFRNFGNQLWFWVAVVTIILTFIDTSWQLQCYICNSCKEDVKSFRKQPCFGDDNHCFIKTKEDGVTRGCLPWTGEQYVEHTGWKRYHCNTDLCNGPIG
ncbi:unnamed protein product [Allacma fusca]|uniref:Snake toxin/toxin-like domain-containing protein n=1 Tax=Allacma fusca TaxID=39272 RepID=A0A8J2NK45_9HEXA|nr:unnamed protein product [Allacma fusca]